MKVGFGVEEDGTVWVNALADGRSLEEISVDEWRAIALLDFTDRKTKVRGDLGQAFEALRLLIGVCQCEGSLCYAVEEMLEEVFEAGRKYERSLRVETPTS